MLFLQDMWRLGGSPRAEPSKEGSKALLRCTKNEICTLVVADEKHSLGQAARVSDAVEVAEEPCPSAFHCLYLFGAGTEL